MGRLRFWLFLSVLPALICHVMAGRRAERDGFRMTRPALMLLCSYYAVAIHFCFLFALEFFETRVDYDDAEPVAMTTAAVFWYMLTLFLLRQARRKMLLKTSYRYLLWRSAMLFFLTPECIYLEKALWSLFGGGPQ